MNVSMTAEERVAMAEDQQLARDMLKTLVEINSEKVV